MAGMRRDITDVFTIIHRVRDDGGRKQKGRGTKVRESAAALAAVCYQQRSTMIQSLIGPYTLLNAVLYRTPYHPSSWRNCHYRLYRKYQVHALVIHSQGRLLSKEPRIIVMKVNLKKGQTDHPSTLCLDTFYSMYSSTRVQYLMGESVSMIQRDGRWTW